MTSRKQFTKDFIMDAYCAKISNGARSDILTYDINSTPWDKPIFKGNLMYRFNWILENPTISTNPEDANLLFEYYYIDDPLEEIYSIYINDASHMQTILQEQIR
tara:strand:+ start:15908 stop:16219 length:312 start_codon:yes stop_codon:yes gene_type:complete